MKKERNSSSKYITFFLILVIVLGSASYAIYKLVIEEPVEVKKVIVKNKIEGWDYTLDDRDTEIMKVEFEKLKNVLTMSEIDYSEYATRVSKLYIIDLYTLNNKLSSYDIPCLEYVIPSYKEDFENKIMNTLYKSIINNSNGKRTQKLPEVKSVEVIEMNEIETGYEVKLSWEYIEDLGYDQESTLYLVKEGKKLYITKQVTGE